MLYGAGSGKGHSLYSILLHNLVVLFYFIDVLEFLVRFSSFQLLKAAVEAVDRFCSYDIFS